MPYIAPDNHLCGTTHKPSRIGAEHKTTTSNSGKVIYQSRTSRCLAPETNTSIRPTSHLTAQWRPAIDTEWTESAENVYSV